MRRVIVLVSFGLLLPAGAMAQLSPGDLSEAHKHLEGLSNCTQCHVLGEKVSNQKCLDCHTEIRDLINTRSGYHASRVVKGKDCAECHSEHHGRKFDMVRFDEENFNHRLTGYELTGAHTRIDCRDCHQPEYITDADLKERTGTYLGLEPACINCHEDYHQKTLGNDCTQCHTTESFAPAEKFDHNNTAFVLLGEHRNVDCIECHKMEMRNGNEFQHFTDIDFANCNSCHGDVHQGNLGTNCKQCHTEEGFSLLAGLRNFNHNTTGFPLKGRHRSVDCTECHKMGAAPSRLFQDNIGISTNACATCHEDVHEGKFGNNCVECHNEDSFRMKMDPDRFDHDLTGFALEGKHETVDCRKCHVSESLTNPLPHNTCASCHEDYHEGEFAEAGVSPDCADCHTVEGFSPGLFSIADHAESDFPLTGGHVATPCFACHLQDNEWHFKNIGIRCVDCHEDVHAGEMNAKYYLDQDCASCHVTDGWHGENLFNHSLTEFELSGAHLRTDCGGCHAGDEEKPHGRFMGISQVCADCHDNIHGSQFEKGGVTDCTRCHGFENWSLADFNHDETAFPLEGKHAEVACVECHKPVDRDGEMIVQYQIQSFECIDCHM